MGLLHAHGFASTSSEMLAEHLGVNRNSMYAEFGSKQALFDAALEHYDTSGAAPGSSRRVSVRWTSHGF